MIIETVDITGLDEAIANLKALGDTGAEAFAQLASAADAATSSTSALGEAISKVSDDAPKVADASEGAVSAGRSSDGSVSAAAALGGGLAALDAADGGGASTGGPGGGPSISDDPNRPVPVEVTNWPASEEVKAPDTGEAKPDGVPPDGEIVPTAAPPSASSISSAAETAASAPPIVAAAATAAQTTVADASPAIQSDVTEAIGSAAPAIVAAIGDAAETVIEPPRAPAPTPEIPPAVAPPAAAPPIVAATAAETAIAKSAPVIQADVTQAIDTAIKASAPPVPAPLPPVASTGLFGPDYWGKSDRASAPSALATQVSAPVPVVVVGPAPGVPAAPAFVPPSVAASSAPPPAFVPPGFRNTSGQTVPFSQPAAAAPQSAPAAASPRGNDDLENSAKAAERARDRMREAAKVGAEAFQGTKEAVVGLTEALDGMSAAGAISTLEGVGHTVTGLVASLGTLGTVAATVVGGLTAIGGAMGAVALAGGELAHSTAEDVVGMEDIARTAGTSIQQVEGLKDAFSKAGVSADGIGQALKNLAIRSEAEWPSVAKSSRDAADNAEKDALKIKTASHEVETAKDGEREAVIKTAEASNAVLDAKEKQQTAQYDVADAQLALLKAEQQQEIAHTGKPSDALASEIKAEEEDAADRAVARAQIDLQAKARAAKAAPLETEKAEIAQRAAQRDQEAAPEKLSSAILELSASIKAQQDNRLTNLDAVSDALKGGDRNGVDLAKVSPQTLLDLALRNAGPGASGVERFASIADIFAKLPGQQQAAFGREALGRGGFTPEVGNVLARGGDNIRENAGKPNAIGKLIEDAIAASLKFRISEEGVKDAFRQDKLTAGSAALPGATQGADRFKELLEGNQDAARKIGAGLGEAMSLMASNADQGATAIKGLAAAIGALTAASVISGFSKFLGGGSSAVAGAVAGAGAAATEGGVAAIAGEAMTALKTGAKIVGGAVGGAVLAGSEAGNKEVLADPAVAEQIRHGDKVKEENFQRYGAAGGALQNLIESLGAAHPPAPPPDVEDPSIKAKREEDARARSNERAPAPTTEFIRGVKVVHSPSETIEAPVSEKYVPRPGVAIRTVPEIKPSFPASGGAEISGAGFAGEIGSALQSLDGAAAAISTSPVGTVLRGLSAAVNSANNESAPSPPLGVSGAAGATAAAPLSTQEKPERAVTLPQPGGAPTPGPVPPNAPAPVVVDPGILPPGTPVEKPPQKAADELIEVIEQTTRTIREDIGLDATGAKGGQPKDGDLGKQTEAVAKASESADKFGAAAVKQQTAADLLATAGQSLVGAAQSLTAADEKRKSEDDKTKAPIQVNVTVAKSDKEETTSSSGGGGGGSGGGGSASVSSDSFLGRYTTPSGIGRVGDVAPESPAPLNVAPAPSAGPEAAALGAVPGPPSSEHSSPPTSAAPSLSPDNYTPAYVNDFGQIHPARPYATTPESNSVQVQNDVPTGGTVQVSPDPLLDAISPSPGVIASEDKAALGAAGAKYGFPTLTTAERTARAQKGVELTPSNPNYVEPGRRIDVLPFGSVRQGGGTPAQAAFDAKARAALEQSIGRKLAPDLTLGDGSDGVYRAQEPDGTMIVAPIQDGGGSDAETARRQSISDAERKKLEEEEERKRRLLEQQQNQDTSPRLYASGGYVDDDGSIINDVRAGQARLHSDVEGTDFARAGVHTRGFEAPPVHIAPVDASRDLPHARGVTGVQAPSVHIDPLHIAPVSRFRSVDDRREGGGHIRGQGSDKSDSIHAMLSDGEFVMRAAAVEKYGVEAMHAVNDGLAPRFADGGEINFGDTFNSTTSVLSAAQINDGMMNSRAFADGGALDAMPARSNSDGLHPVHLTIEGQKFDPMLAPPAVAEALSRFTMDRKIARSGPAQSWVS